MARALDRAGKAVAPGGRFISIYNGRAIEAGRGG
jgi:hypothetical protein